MIGFLVAIALQVAPASVAPPTPAPSPELGTLSAYDIREQPPIRGLTKAIEQSDLDGVEVELRLEYSASGDVLTAGLVRSTGNEKLDASLLEFARQLKFKPKDSGGTGLFPMTLVQPR